MSVYHSQEFHLLNYYLWKKFHCSMKKGVTKLVKRQYTLRLYSTFVHNFWSTPLSTHQLLSEFLSHQQKKSFIFSILKVTLSKKRINFPFFFKKKMFFSLFKKKIFLPKALCIFKKCLCITSLFPLEAYSLSWNNLLLYHQLKKFCNHILFQNNHPNFFFRNIL